MGDDAGEVVTCQLSVSTSEATVETTGESRALRLWLERSKRAGTMNFLLHFRGTSTIWFVLASLAICVGRKWQVIGSCIAR